MRLIALLNELQIELVSLETTEPNLERVFLHLTGHAPARLEDPSMLIWTLARKDLRLLVRDPRAVVVLLAMPFIFILVLGVSLGEGFGQKPDDRLRISIVDLDEGYTDPDAKERRRAPITGRRSCRARPGPDRRHSRRGDRHRSKRPRQLVANGKRAAVLVFGPKFSEQMTRSSFLRGRRQSVVSRRRRSQGARRPRAARSHATDGRFDHRAGRAGDDAARRAALDDRPGVRTDRRSAGADRAKRAASRCFPTTT